MRFLAIFLIWILLTVILSYWLNWSFGFFSPLLVLPFYRLSILKAIALGLLVGCISWGLPAIFINEANGSQLAGMVGNLLKVDSAVAIILLSTLLGGIGVSLGSWITAILFRPDKLIH